MHPFRVRIVTTTPFKVQVEIYESYHCWFDGQYNISALKTTLIVNLETLFKTLPSLGMQ